MSSPQRADETLLTQISWFDKNSKQLQPNQWGLYDMRGNLLEWTFDKRRPDPVGAAMRDDVEAQDLRVSNEVVRTRRGGSFTYDGSAVRPPHCGATTYFPNQTRGNVGFRIVRNMRDPQTGR